VTRESELSNIRQVTQSVNLTCPIYDGFGALASLVGLMIARNLMIARKGRSS
jgi:hypothetical protein